MPGKRALQHFESMNCAQAVLKAFQEERDIPEAKVEALSACGGGKAEGGVCGALHAARQLMASAGQREILDQRFAETAGALLCREIRALKKLNCAGCVETAASLAQKISGERP